ncbi:hypothetical protein E2C01_037044 [Portunus trituberculatus]|uniref:Uncharacterized protein n=1 Tax=Portunus trituberculatus TaxID=210409 RepID=A0A5B7FEB5_PORTR|nr:hypothetical protein [Portunus trituberculatus]
MTLVERMHPGGERRGTGFIPLDAIATDLNPPIHLPPLPNPFSLFSSFSFCLLVSLSLLLVARLSSLLNLFSFSTLGFLLHPCWPSSIPLTVSYRPASARHC